MIDMILVIYLGSNVFSVYLLLPTKLCTY